MGEAPSPPSERIKNWRDSKRRSDNGHALFEGNKLKYLKYSLVSTTV